MEDGYIASDVTPSQAALIDRLVTEKVTQQMQSFRSEMGVLTSRLDDVEDAVPEDKGTIVLFSGEFDTMIAAFIIATGAASMGTEVTMFFPFWGVSAIRKQTIYKAKPITEKLLSLMLPKGPASVGTSRMNMMGMGPVFFKYMMKKKQVQTLPELIEMAQELEVRMVACEMSMSVMGITQEELIDGVELGGVAVCMCEATNSRFTFFI